MFRMLALAGLVLLSPSSVVAGDPFAARVRYDDVERFYRVYDAAGGHPSADQLRRDYIEAGSDAVREFHPQPYRIGQGVGDRDRRRSGYV